MKTNILINFDGKEKRVYQDIWSGDLYIKHKKEKFRCKWVDNDFIDVEYWHLCKVIKDI